jgi:hypothetical protein
LALCSVDLGSTGGYIDLHRSVETTSERIGITSWRVEATDNDNNIT